MYEILIPLQLYNILLEHREENKKRFLEETTSKSKI